MKYFKILEFANFSPNITGLNNVYIWMAPPPPSHSYRIKVSNVLGKYAEDDCFSISVPDLIIDGDNKLNNKNFNNVKEFIIKYKDAIIAFEDKKIYKNEFYMITHKVLNWVTKVRNLTFFTQPT